MKHHSAVKYDPVNIALKDVDFELMYEGYFDALCLYAKKITGNKEEAEHIVQDLFVNLLENRDIYRVTEKLSSYLYQGVKNTCWDYLKHEKVKREHSKYVQMMHNNGDRLLTQDDNDPHSLLELQVEEEEKKKVIDILPAQQRAIFLLWLDSVSYQDIAHKLFISINTVRTQLTRAKATLRKFIENKKN